MEYLSEQRVQARRARASRGERVVPPPPVDWGGYAVPADDRSGWPELRLPAARKAFATWLTDGPTRREALRSLLARNGVMLDASDKGIQRLNDWLFRHVEADAADPARPSARWAGVIDDIGRFLGDTLIERCPGLGWSLSESRKGHTDFRRVVIVGWPEPWGSEASPLFGFLESIAGGPRDILAGDLDPAVREHADAFRGARAFVLQLQSWVLRGTPGHTRDDWYAWVTMQGDRGRG